MLQASDMEIDFSPGTRRGEDLVTGTGTDAAAENASVFWRTPAVNNWARAVGLRGNWDTWCGRTICGCSACACETS